MLMIDYAASTAFRRPTAAAAAAAAAWRRDSTALLIVSLPARQSNDPSMSCLTPAEPPTDHSWSDSDHAE